jgi:MGT family glycosyltransferase
MADRHIAFIGFPHSPHVNPTLPMVSALVRRGYRVTYATSDRFSWALESLGVEVVPCSRFVLEISPEGEIGKSTPRNDVVANFSAKMLDQITPFYKRHRPDLIIYDFMAFAGRILARHLDVPAVQTSPFYALSEEEFESQVRQEPFRRALLDHAGIIAQFLNQYGVKSTNYRCDKEKLNIYFFPKVLQPSSAAFGDDCLFAGRCAVERAVMGEWHDNSGGRPIALVAMSTIRAASSAAAVKVPRYYRMCIDALSGLGWHVVLCIAERCDASSLLPVPEHCEIVPHTAYLRVLARAKLLFFMSGIISTTEAAYRGVPMIAITEGQGEFEWQADRIVEVGIGAHIRKEDTSAENLRVTAVELTKNMKIENRSKEVARIVRREPGGEEAANWLEDYLEAEQ